MTTEKTDNLTALRSAVARLDEDEKLALAAFLTLECTSQVTFPEFQDRGCYSEALKNGFEASTGFSRVEKLAFAIELLLLCQDKEEDKGDELPDPSDYEDEEYYSSGSPLFGQHDGDVYNGGADIDALPGFYQGY